MSLTADFLDTLAVAAERSPGPRTLPWPMPGNLGALHSFASFSDWRTFFLSFRLPYGVPQNMTDGFDRASKLYLLAWIDFDLMVAGEMVALSTLEHVLRDCYLGKERERRRTIVNENAQKEKRKPTRKERTWVERISLEPLLKYMIDHDALTDDKLPLTRRCGGSVMGLLTGERNPSLVDIRNTRAHGDPFGSGFQAGLLELIRDLIAYAYRDRIAEARALFPNRFARDA